MRQKFCLTEQITVRLPQSGDEKISGSNTIIAEPVKQTENIEKKKLTKEAKPEFSATEKNPPPAEVNLKKETNTHSESDQEKMILELFDGQYVE